MSFLHRYRPALIYLLTVVCIVIFLFIVYSQGLLYSVTQPTDSSETLLQNITIRLIAPSWNQTYHAPTTMNNTVAAFLDEYATHYDIHVEKEYFSGYDSYFIEAIGTYHNGENNRYWQFYVNNEYAMVGCSQYLLEDHDSIEWRFEQDQWS